jgi:hypothetical protein
MRSGTHQSASVAALAKLKTTTENVMIKLTKKSDAHWMGNGFGNAPAEWVVKGADHLHVWSSGGNKWNVTDRDTGKRLVRWAYTKKAALEAIAELLPELSA